MVDASKLFCGTAASPILVEGAVVLVNVSGARHLATLTNRTIIGLDPKTGRQVWSIPFPDDWHENIVTPVVSGSSIVVSGIRQGTRAFAISRAGAGFSPVEVWKNAEVTMYMSSPVAGDGLIYGLSAKRKGQFVALDASTGVTKWASEGREGEQASVLLAPEHVVYLTNTGALVVVRRTAAGFQEQKRYDISDNETGSTPVFVGGSILVRDATHLVRLDPK